MKSVYLVILICLALLMTFCAPPPATEATTSLPPAATEVKPGIANPASVYCKEQGGQLEIRDGNGGQSGYCIFLDGSECEEWAYFRNECAPGNTTPQTSPDAIEEDFTPLSSNECDSLAESMQKALSVDVNVSNAPFQDYITGKTGTGCHIIATGTGVNFPDFVAAEQGLRSMLGNAGWREDIQYSAGGPTGSASGYRSENRLCLLNVSWLASADTQCSDKPIADCDLKPEQKLFTITLHCAQESQK